MSISVVIPAYNAGQFIRSAIESTLTQTLKPDEVIVVDDGSNDDTVWIATQLGARVIKQRNGGPGMARNSGVAAATGDWVAFLDADDRWFSNKLQSQLALSASADLVYTGILVEREADGSSSPSPALPVHQLWPALLYRNPVPPSTVLARRQLLVAFPFRPDIRGCEDWDCWVRMYRAGTRFACTPEPLVYYREAAGSVSSNAQRMLRDFQKILEPTLLADMNGISRWVWRKRSTASQLFSAAMIERQYRNVVAERSYLLKSVAAWPFPGFRPERFRALAYSLLPH